MSLEPIRIGLVEDDPHVRDGIGRALADVPGWRLHALADSLAGAERLPFAELSLLLLDIGLPDGSSLRLLPRLPTALPVLVISALGDEATVVTAIERGAAGYLLKEAHPRELIASIQAVLDGGAPISPGVAAHLLRRMRQPRAPVAEPRVAALDQLTAREAEVLRVLTRGYSYEETAELLEISRHTVGQHIKQIYAKLAVNSRSQAVFQALQAGWLGQP